MTRARRLSPLVGLVLVAAACTASAEADTASGEPFEESPLPTIGLGSDLGSISGGTDIRAIDTGQINELVMIGDSITVGSTPLLEDQLSQLGFETVSITAMTGKRMGVSFGSNASGANIAQFIANAQDSDPDETLWVVALGTNDVGQYSSQEEIEEVVDRVLEPIPVDAPLIWINTYFASRPDDTAEVNAAIEAKLVERGNATIGRWSEIAPADGVLRGDGVHPGDAGAKVFADLVTMTVANFLQ